MQDQSDGAAGSPAGWAPEVVREQLQAFRSSDDLLSFFTELKDLVHVSAMRCNFRKTPLCHILVLVYSFSDNLLSFSTEVKDLIQVDGSAHRDCYHCCLEQRWSARVP